MIAKYLWEMGSLILVLLGSVHLYYTFFTNKFFSKNENLISEMKNASPILTDETTMWKAWIGFNASHSSGAIFIGIFNLYMAIFHFALFSAEPFFFIFNILTVAFYVWLARKYWFSIPLLGISLTLICFVLSYVFILFK